MELRQAVASHAHTAVHNMRSRSLECNRQLNISLIYQQYFLDSLRQPVTKLTHLLRRNTTARAILLHLGRILARGLLLPERRFTETWSLAVQRMFLKATLAALLSALPLVASAGETIETAWTLCEDQAARTERAHDLPAHLLAAIAKTESGRWHAERRETLAWPWTVMAEGRGRFLPTKAAAIDTVRELQARGVRNIDVGCMQVNLYHHPDAFDSLEAAFDPATNLDYAATFLAELREDARSWTKAVGQYHSRQAVRGNTYRAKVFKAWRAERHRANRERRAALQAARNSDS